MSSPKKILVIGASIAGPAVCYWLKKFNFLPTLIERRPILSKGGYGIDARGIAVDVTKKMGIYDSILQQRTQIKSGCYVDAKGNILYESHGETLGIRQGDEVEIIRGDLVEILMELIHGTLPIYFHQSIHHIKQDADQVEVHFKNGDIQCFDLVIGADGLHSTTREMAFDRDECELFNLNYYISVFSTPNFLHLDHSALLFEKDKKLTSISSDRDPTKALTGFMFQSNHILKDIRNEGEQKRFLYDLFHDLGWEVNTLLDFMEKSDDFYFDSMTQVKMKSYSKGRVALLGDAGYCASPLSGQGTSLALVGAYILAGELKRAQGDHEEAFHRYHQLLQPFVEANQEFGAWVSQTFFASHDLVGTAAAERYDHLLERMETVTRAISLPEYD